MFLVGNLNGRAVKLVPGAFHQGLEMGAIFGCQLLRGLMPIGRLDVFAQVRECPEELGKSLAQYTHDSGSHVHLQVTEEPIS